MGSNSAHVPKVVYHGSHAQQRKGYLPEVPPVQAHRSLVGEAVRCGHRQGDLQHGQEGLHPFPDRCCPPRLPRHPPGQDDCRQQDCPHPPPRASPPPSLRTSTASSRRPSPCASTSRRTARTRTPSSVSFSSSPASTASRVTTAWPRCSQPTSSMSLPTPLPSSSKLINARHEIQ